MRHPEYPSIPEQGRVAHSQMAIDDPAVTADFITGKIKINFLNSKQLRVGRRSGLLPVEGGRGNSSGQCEATDRNAPRKF